MRHLDLFSGIGGFALAARNVGWETVAFCEIDSYCQRVLAKHWPDVPIYGDIRTFNGLECDLITGGYPCQPFSLAGVRRGDGDPRHLWPEAFRLVRELRPSRAVFENVAGHITMGLDAVLSDLEGIGYTCETFVIPACAVDAPHRRDRVWIICHSNRDRKSDVPIHAAVSKLQNVDDTNSAHGERGRLSSRTQQKHSDIGGDGRWQAEPGVGRVANGIPNRVDRLRALGNAIVPQVAEVIFKAINEANKQA